MKTISISLAFVAGFVFCVIIFFILSFNEHGRPVSVANRHKTSMPAVMRAPELPQQMNFAGETVPLERWDIREQLDRELIYNYYQPGNIFYMLKLSKKYFPLIEAKLAENNIPDDFKWLCVAESNLQNAVSRAGAAGFWQFMKGTAPVFDLEVSPTVDERYHVNKSTDAACAYIKRAYERFGSWTAAAASYNCGIGGYAERSNFQGSTNYYNIALPEETQRYIFRILAFKHILSNADSLGFKILPSQHYEPIKTKVLVVDQSIHNLSSFARNNGTDYRMLKLMNPWLRERSLTVRKGKTYGIIIPEK
jgi:membrane-bound lytic murein transglycosylase D